MNDIINFLHLSPHLATAGQPTAEQLAAVRAAGFDTVVNLALPTSPGALEDEARDDVDAAARDQVRVWEPNGRWQRFLADVKNGANQKEYS